MRRLLIPMLLLAFASSGCNTIGSLTAKPPLNCLGNAYDGSSSPCYHPPGPFWCCLPGPCSTCRDPYLRYYQTENAGWIGRPVCNPTYALDDLAAEEEE